MNKFERPVDFEPKMLHLKQVLEEVKQQEHFMDLRTDDVDDLKNCQEHCMVSDNTRSFQILTIKAI